MEFSIVDKKIPELLFRAAEKNGDRIALMVNRGDGTLDTITYNEFRESVTKLSSFLQQTGFKKNEHIALLGTNSPAWAIAYLGIQTAGCVVVPLDIAQKPQELRHIIRHSDAVGIFLSSKLISVIQDEEGEHFQNLPHFELEHIDSLIKTETSPLPPRLPANNDELASIIYTSGTTGSPKGVMLSHRNIVCDIAGVVTLFPFTPQDNFLSVLPIHHAFECTAGFLTPVSMGCGICYARTLRAKEILEDIAASNTTILLGVPLLFEKFHNGILKAVGKKSAVTRSLFSSTIGLTRLLDSIFGGKSGKGIMKLFRKKSGFGNMWLMISGGAAIKSDVVEFFNHFGVTFVQGYGLTEASPILTVNPPHRVKAASVGTAIGDVILKIADPNESGIGEVIAKGSSVFAGYYKNPYATEEAFTEDGWFKTGDLGWFDNEDYLFLTGRLKNIIVTSGGKNVYPEEIEEKLNQQEFILESLVTGIRKGNDEEPFAIIVPDYEKFDAKFSGSYSDTQVEVAIKDAVESVNCKIASYKRIKGFKIQAEEFPKTSTRKIKRYLYQGKEVKL